MLKLDTYARQGNVEANSAYVYRYLINYVAQILVHGRGPAGVTLLKLHCASNYAAGDIAIRRPIGAKITRTVPTDRIAADAI